MRNIEKEKDREKEKIGDIGPVKLNDKKSDRGVERQRGRATDKEPFFVGGTK